MPKVGGKRKKSRTHKEPENPDSEFDKTPRSLIFKRGKVPALIKDLVQDMREIFYPNTAMHLKESTHDKLKDYVACAKDFKVSHMLAFSSTETSNYLRVIKMPHGPTFTFKLLQYSLRRDIHNTSTSAKTFARNYLFSPLVILNGFKLPENEGKAKKNTYDVLSLMLQSLFPPLNLNQMNIDNCRRVVMFSFDKETEIIDLRHYWIQKSVVGVNKKLKNFMEAKKLPDLSKYTDVADFFLNSQNAMSGYGSDAEGENLPDAQFDEEKRKIKKKMTVKLYEEGPRLRLKLVKIQEGFMSGNVMYHRFVSKSPEEKAAQKKLIRERKREKEQRKQEMLKKRQEQMAKEEEKKKLRQDKKKAREAAGRARRGEREVDEEEEKGENGGDNEFDGDDDAEGGDDDDEYGGIQNFELGDVDVNDDDDQIMGEKENDVDDDDEGDL